MKEQKQLYLILTILLFALTLHAFGQPDLQKEFSSMMEIQSVITMGSSPAHLYILSDTEGMVVFRAHADSLQWLYSSPGMERRGDTMTADIRFAYLFGSGRRLTILEPTSVLGVYSSTLLPASPLDAKRMNSDLYVAMGSKGLGQLSLATPQSVDSTVVLIERSRFRDENIIDLETSESQLFVLASDGKLFLFNKTENGISFSKEVRLMRELEHIFVVGQNLLGSDSAGRIYEIDSTGNMAQMGSIDEPVKKIEMWKNWLVIQGNSDRIWTSYQNRAPKLWKDDRNAGNLFEVTKDQLWLCEYSQISRIVTADNTQVPVSQNTSSTSGQLKLKPIDDVTVPYPKPILLAIELEGDYSLSDANFTYQSNVENAQIKGNGFYWQPQASDAGTYNFKIVATSSDGQVDSTSFSVNVRSFNSPPRFSPIRPITIPVGEPFTLPLKATDPDGMNPDLIRYLGVDLPEGSGINELTGEFRWTPTARQVGENTFQIIATDQYGAASQVDITIRVSDVKRSEGAGG